MIVIRSFTNTFFGLVIAFSQFYVSLQIVHTIYGSGPIFIFIFDYYLNGVKVNSKQVLGIIVDIFGLTITINGRLLMSFID